MTGIFWDMSQGRLFCKLESDLLNPLMVLSILAKHTSMLELKCSPDVESVEPPAVGHVQQLVGFGAAAELHVLAHRGDDSRARLDAGVEGGALLDDQLAGALGLAVLVGGLAGVGAGVCDVDATNEQVATGEDGVLAAGSQLVAILPPEILFHVE